MQHRILALAAGTLSALLSTSAFAHTNAHTNERIEVRYLPGHPMANVAGFVAMTPEVAEAFDREALPESWLAPDAAPTGGIAGGGMPPSVPGWPITVPGPRPQEGGLLVHVSGETKVLFATAKTVHLRNLDGTSMPGWPITVPYGNSLSGGPAFGDVTGDGQGEIIVTAENWPNGTSAWTVAYRIDGTLVPGFPAMSQGDHSRSPTVADLTGNGRAEIIVGERKWPNGKVYVFDGDGDTLPGWPVDIDHVPASSAGAADLTGDGFREVVYQSLHSVHAFKIDGTTFGFWPFTPLNNTQVFSYAAPVFADLTGDGNLEVAVGAHASGFTPSAVYVLDTIGRPIVGWPRFTNHWVYAPPTFADITGDGQLEVIVGDQVLSFSPANHVYAWRANGTNVPGFPVGPMWAINAQVAVADITGDGSPELFWDDNTLVGGATGTLNGYHANGQPIDGWPITTAGMTYFNTAAFADVNNDGTLEMLVLTGFNTAAAGDATAYLWDFDAQAAGAVQMPMFQYGPGRDGLMSPKQSPAPCPGDLTGSGSIGVPDLLELLSKWGPCPAPCPADLTGSGSVGVPDLLELLSQWGPCPL